MGSVKYFLAGIVCTLTIILALSFAVDTVSASSQDKSIDVAFGNIRILLNGNELIPKDAGGNVVEPFIYKGTTYVPLRAIADAFEKEVFWHPAHSENIIAIYDTLLEDIPAQDIKYGIDDDGRVQITSGFKNIRDLTTSDMREKLNCQVFYVCNKNQRSKNNSSYLLYEDGRFIKLPSIYPYNSPHAKFTVTDINQDGQYGLLYTIPYEQFNYLFFYSKKYENVAPFGTYEHEYEIASDNNAAAFIRFHSGEEAKLSLVFKDNEYALDVALPDDMNRKLLNSAQSCADFKSRVLQRKSEWFVPYSSFVKITAGMSIDKVHEILGEPHYIVGSGIISDGYDLEDGTLLIINYGAEREYVHRADLRTIDGVDIEIFDIDYSKSP